ncbi:MAG: hypothetical protein R3C25_10135 [Hyphomonadaceae bacterium]
MSKLALFQAASAADKAWMIEVARIFGNSEAGLARFHGRATGEPGSQLRALYLRYVETSDAYESALR